MKLQTVALVVALAAPLLSSGCSSESHAQEAATPSAAVALESVVAQREDVDSLYIATATVRGHNTAIMTSKVVGYVRDVRVNAGDTVKAGQVVAVLEADVIAGSARRAKASFASSKHGVSEAENGLRAAESSLSVAKSTFDRVQSLFSSGSVSDQQLDDARAHHQAAVAARDMAKSRVNLSRSRVDESRAALSEANAMLGYAEVRAPFAGRVIERKVDPGNLASPGMPLMVVEQDGALRVEASVDETQAASIHVGDEVTVTVPALGAAMVGLVSQVVPSIDTASRALMVKVELKQTEARLRPGMFARASFRVGKKQRLVVPQSAVVAQGQLDRVFVIEDGVARLRLVTLGLQQDDWVEVLSGLDAGERVAKSPPDSLRDETRTTH